MDIMDRLKGPRRNLPIGIQSFERLRRDGYLYVDKTAFVYELASTGNPYFLSRPRRFGKSLLLSTLEAYFCGKKELFEGLAIEQLETEWNEHAVLHLDLNAEDYSEIEGLRNGLELQLRSWEKVYGTSEEGLSYSGRFMQVIKEAYRQTGRGVVVLIDEYDKPLLRSMHNPELQDKFREMLTAFYTVLKSADPWLRFVFITGVTKFAQMGIFSTLNQLIDISFDPQYNALCGMTRPEIEANFVPELERLAERNGLTKEDCMAYLTRMYDGYHFNYVRKEGMYNPFSILNVLRSGMFENYWFASGTPTFLAEMLKKTHYDLRELDGLELDKDLLAFKARLEDRFGKVPPEGLELLRIVPLRRLAKRLGVEKVFLKAGRMTLFFISNQESPYYQSAAFGKVIDYMSKNPRYCNLREQNGKRSMVVKNVETVETAVGILQEMVSL